MTQHANNIANALFGVFTSIMTVFALQLTAQYLMNTYLYEPSEWRDYLSISPIRREFSVGEDLVFDSVTRAKRGSIVHGNDALMCDGVLYSRALWGPTISEKTHDTNGVDRVRWRYAGDVPRYSTTCYIRADVYNEVGPFTALNVTRSSRHTSEMLRIVEAK